MTSSLQQGAEHWRIKLPRLLLLSIMSGLFRSCSDNDEGQGPLRTSKNFFLLRSFQTSRTKRIMSYKSSQDLVCAQFSSVSGIRESLFSSLVYESVSFQISATQTSRKETVQRVSSDVPTK